MPVHIAEPAEDAPRAAGSSKSGKCLEGLRSIAPSNVQPPDLNDAQADGQRDLAA
jgi:hypothetical protein